MSTKDSRFHVFAEFLHNLIHGSIPIANSYIANSFELINKLKGTHIDGDYRLISLDVVSIFTNIPLDLAIESVLKRWSYIEKKCDMNL